VRRCSPPAGRRWHEDRLQDSHKDKLRLEASRKAMIHIMGPQVLIVDDDPALLQALPEALRRRMSEVTVDTAESAAAALDRIAARDYDANVTDIKMPGMDGLALLDETRTRRPETPRVFLRKREPRSARALRGVSHPMASSRRPRSA
jgi:CheY-like chemotaxis protein